MLDVHEGSRGGDRDGRSLASGVWLHADPWEGAISRRRLLATAGAAGALLAAPPWLRGAAAAGAPVDNVVLAWNEAALEGVRRSTLGPPMVARALAIVHTCMYDAWAAYDARAVGTRLGSALRRPRRQRTRESKSKAISFAAYRAAVDLLPGSKATVFDPLMNRLGYDPGDQSIKLGGPSGIGNLAALAVLDARHRDGSNQLGQARNGVRGVPYSDYTGYAPVNAPMNLLEPFDRAAVRDPSRWQPLTYLNRAGVQVTPAFVGPHWYRVKPFALRSSHQFRSRRGPAKFGTRRYTTQCEKVFGAERRLTDRQVAIAEYWADGPNSELPPGHWNLFAQYVSHRDRHDVDEAVKLFFALTNAVFDAGIVAWDSKRAFDSVRPITAIRTELASGGDWLPYQPSWFPTPPFPEYLSGHSCFSAAGAEVLRRFTGSDRFGASATRRAGSSLVEPGVTPLEDVTLRWRTFSEAADEAGMSRRYGGIHFEDGDLDGRAAGRRAGAQAFAKARRLWRGG
ncbi:MAG TPA: vanadium-dependent haloperoxidase [Thermoleophilaceae bacterium]|jgi:hypothetical protein